MSRTVKPILCAMAMVLVASPSARGQFDAIRKARAEIRLPGLDKLFGGEPPLTTSIADAVDGVPQLDDFEPAAYSPLVEMPRGTGGRFFIAPGTYTFDAESYCLKAGTYGAQLKGRGYLYAELKGAKAGIVRNILLRASDHPEIGRAEIQMLLWAIIARARYDKMPDGVQRTARAMLKQQEIRDLSGNALDVVPDAVKNQALEKVPAPVRRVLEAENELRRTLARSDARFEDLERIAVLTGAPPAEEMTDVVRAGRWSYHPNGFFIRFHTEFYANTRIQLYFPAAFRIQRDSKGRIISVTRDDGRGGQTEDDATRGSASTRQPRWFFAVAPSARRARTVADVMRIAAADVADLERYRTAVAARVALGRASAADFAAAQEAEHAALARYYGLRRLSPSEPAAEFVASWRPLRTARGVSYVVAPLARTGEQQGGRKLNSFPPGGGAGVPTEPTQRTGSSARESKPASSSGDNSVQKARKVTKAMQAGGKLLGPAGGGAIPNLLLGAGMNKAFEAAEGVDAALNGEDAKDDGATALGETPFMPVGMAASRAWPPAMRRQQPDFTILSQPAEVPFTPVAASPSVTTNQASLTNAAIASTLRLASTLSAAALAKRRSAAAGAARNAEWEEQQARALLYLRHSAGDAMVQVARDLAALRAANANTAASGATTAQIADAQRQLATSGFPPEVLSVAKALGMTDAAIERYRKDLLETDAGLMSARAPAAWRELEDQLESYGEYWQSLPVVKAPWQ